MLIRTPQTEILDVSTYCLTARCKSLDCLGPTLAAIAAQKNTKRAELVWNYNELQKTQNDLLMEGLPDINETELWGDIGEPIQLIFQMCFTCGTVFVSNQCT